MSRSGDESSDSRDSDSTSQAEQDDDLPNFENAGPAPFKLDMKHGFVKSIIRNQIDRDKYDKFVKSQAKKKKNLKTTPPKQKRPEVALYVPPCKKAIDEPTISQVLFNFEVEDEKGNIHKIPVKQEDDVASLAKDFGRKVGWPKKYVHALSQRLEEEYSKRTKSVG